MSAAKPSKTTLHIACDNIVPGCGFTATGDTEAELIDKVAAHAAEEHGVREMSPELSEKVKSAIVRQ